MLRRPHQAAAWVAPCRFRLSEDMSHAERVQPIEDLQDAGSEPATVQEVRHPSSLLIFNAAHWIHFLGCHTGRAHRLSEHQGFPGLDLHTACLSSALPVAGRSSISHCYHMRWLYFLPALLPGRGDRCWEQCLFACNIPSPALGFVPCFRPQGADLKGC